MDSFEFVQIIETELRARKIKKEKFYKESGISSATMSQWRTRKYSPSPDAIKKVEAYLGINFTVVQKEKPPAKNGEGLLDNILIEKLTKLTPAEQEKVEAFVQGLLASR